MVLNLIKRSVITWASQGVNGMASNLIRKSVITQVSGVGDKVVYEGDGQKELVGTAHSTLKKKWKDV
jgi:hypothetical protein